MKWHGFGIKRSKVKITESIILHNDTSFRTTIALHSHSLGGSKDQSYGQNLEKVKQFCYLGSLVTEDGRSGREVRRRIALGKEAFNKKMDLMQKSLSLHLRKRMVKVFVWSVVLYGSETWTLQKRGYSTAWGIWNVDMEAYDESIMDWAQNKWRRVLQMVNTEREMMDTLRSRQKRMNDGYVIYSDMIHY